MDPPKKKSACLGLCHNVTFSLIYLVSMTADASGARSAKRPLLRPIICICNDLCVPSNSPLKSSNTHFHRYANSLAKLRLHARIIRINPSPPLVVTKRLHSICEQEQLRSERRALNLLAEICQGDLRSCLNALQVRALL